MIQGRPVAAGAPLNVTVARPPAVGAAGVTVRVTRPVGVRSKVKRLGLPALTVRPAKVRVSVAVLTVAVYAPGGTLAAYAPLAGLRLVARPPVAVKVTVGPLVTGFPPLVRVTVTGRV